MAAALEWITDSAMSLGRPQAPAANTPNRLVRSGAIVGVLTKPKGLSSTPMAAARVFISCGGRAPVARTAMSKTSSTIAPEASWYWQMSVSAPPLDFWMKCGMVLTNRTPCSVSAFSR